MISEAVLVGVPVALGAYWIFDSWPRSPERQAERELDKAFGRFERECRRRGLTPAQQQEEFTFRCALARVRRVASDETLKRPMAHDAIIAAAIAEEIKICAMIDGMKAKRFEAAMRALPRQDILYGDAEDAVRRALDGACRPTAMTAQEREDLMAALTTLRR